MDLVYVDNEIQNNYIFEIIKCVDEVILSQRLKILQLFWFPT